MAGCLTSTGNWPDVLQNGRHKPWSVRVLWFSGLVFALFAVMIAGLQSMRLHRLSSHRDGLAMIRAGLAGKSRGHSKNGGSGRRRSLRDRLPLRIQIYAWDASHAFLILSTLMMILGIVVLVWVSTEYGPGKPEGSGWWDDNAKVSCIFFFFWHDNRQFNSRLRI